MGKSLDVIEELRKEKKEVLDGVYTEKKIDEVYRKQTNLSAMSISIYTDVAARLLSALEEDGVGREVWADISKRLKKLSFTGVPTESDIRTKYKDAIDASVSGKNFRDYDVEPKDRNADSEEVVPKMRISIKEKLLPTSLALFAEVIAIPLVWMGKWNILAKVVLTGIDGAAMAIEIIYCFGKRSEEEQQSRKPMNVTSNKGSVSEIDYDKWYQKVIEQVQEDNTDTLNQWFDDLKNITKEEIEKVRK